VKEQTHKIKQSMQTAITRL